MMQSTSAAAPAFTCTTAPPAKSSAPRSNSQPPPKIQWHTGTYTSNDHSAMKPTHAPKRMRSAIAPVISAGVMTANVSWKATNSNAGMVPETSLPMPLRPMKSKFPIQPPSPAFPNASEYPTKTQMTATMPIAKKFCMSIARMFFALTIPP
jgi:hypothetical protein